MRIIVILLIITAAASVSAGSFYNAELNLNGGSTSNLYKNQDDSSDVYSTINGTLNLFPTSFVEFNLLTDYTIYKNNSSLSNLKYGGGFTVLPLKDSSKFTILLTTNYQGYSYKDALTTNSSEFTDKGINGIFSLGYEFYENFHIRTGFNYTQTGYATEEVSDKKTNEIFGGINFSVFGSHAFDIEGGYSFEKYDYLPDVKEQYIIIGNDTLASFINIYPIDSSNAYSSDIEDDLNSFYLSARYSRPLGNKTGLSITYSYRKFQEIKDSTFILGNSTGYLSPWVKSFEGSSIQAKIKTYMIPQFIITGGFGYWDKSHLRTLESYLGVVSTVNAADRADDMHRYFLTIQLPIVTASGRFFEPTLNIEFTNNNSSISNYDYTDFTITTGLNIRL